MEKKTTETGWLYIYLYIIDKIYLYSWLEENGAKSKIFNVRITE